MHGRLMANLADGREIAIYPSLGVPTSESVHRAVKNSDSCPSVAVVYDHIGLDKDWIKHIDWLGSHIKTAQWDQLAELLGCLPIGRVRAYGCYISFC